MPKILTYCSLLLFSLFFTIANGQNEVVSKKESQEVKKQEAYWYADQSLERPQVQAPKGNFHIPPIIGLIFRFLMWGIVGVAVIAMLYFVIRNLNFNWNTATDKTEEITHEVNDEKKLRELDYNELISKAIANSDYRLAVRWYYLWVLKELSSRDKIVYDKFKTNNEYKQKLREVMGGSHKYLPIFNACVKYYEYIWFGQFPISRDQYDEIEVTFKAGINQI